MASADVELQGVEKWFGSFQALIGVTHEMSFARRVADRVIFMATGMIVAEGALEEFFNNPRHKRRKTFLARFWLTETQYRRRPARRSVSIFA
jgi:ABC-type polar amino acid transport system ATPase subunit